MPKRGKSCLTHNTEHLVELVSNQSRLPKANRPLSSLTQDISPHKCRHISHPDVSVLQICFSSSEVVSETFLLQIRCDSPVKAIWLHRVPSLFLAAWWNVDATAHMWAVKSGRAVIWLQPALLKVIASSVFSATLWNVFLLLEQSILITYDLTQEFSKNEAEFRRVFPKYVFFTWILYGTSIHII